MIDTAQWDLHGPVRKVRSEMAEWERDRGAWSDRRFFRAVAFDAGGRIAHLDQRGLHGVPYRTAYVYDPQGRLIEEASGPAGEPPQFRRRWAYDGHGRETSIAVVRADGTEEPWQQSTYDPQGRRTDRMTLAARQDAGAHAYAVKGSEFGYGAPAATLQTTRYDAAGRPVDVEFQDADGGLVRRVRMTRDDGGRVVLEEAEMTPAVAVTRDPGMTDAQFHGMQALMTAAFGTMRTVYEYDALGRTSRRVQTTGQLGESRTAYRYDDRGNAIEQSEVRIERAIEVDENGVGHQAEPDTVRVHDVRFAYVYDRQGNWTEKAVSARYAEGGEFVPTNAEWRTIEYGD
jgi:hypothetical protein